MTVSMRDPQHMSAAEIKAEVCELLSHSLLRVIGKARIPCLPLSANREPNAVGEVRRSATGGTTPNTEEEPQCPL